MDTPQAPWTKYMDEAAPVDPVARFLRHVDQSRTFIAAIPEAKRAFRYAPEKWSVKQWLGHINDTNIVFFYRLTCIARGEVQPLPGFDENEYMGKVDFDAAAWEDLVQVHHGLGQTASALIRGFDSQAWNRRGTANKTSLSPLEMLRVWIGHERHHIRVLQERYGIA